MSISVFLFLFLQVNACFADDIKGLHPFKKDMRQVTRSFIETYEALIYSYNSLGSEKLYENQEEIDLPLVEEMFTIDQLAKFLTINIEQFQKDLKKYAKKLKENLIENGVSLFSNYPSGGKKIYQVTINNFFLSSTYKGENHLKILSEIERDIENRYIEKLKWSDEQKRLIKELVNGNQLQQKYARFNFIQLERIHKKGRKKAAAYLRLLARRDQTIDLGPLEKEFSEIDEDSRFMSDAMGVRFCYERDLERIEKLNKKLQKIAQSMID